MKTFLVAAILFQTAFLTVSGQELAEASDKISLKALLTSWQELHVFQYSGRDDLLQQCLVDVSFSEPSELQQLLKPCRLKVEVKNGVHIITKRPERYLISGYVADAETRIPIPNASVKHGDKGTLTNEYGQFMLASKEEIAEVDISHVSYGASISKIESGMENFIEMKRQNVKLNEVVVGGSSTESSERNEEPYALLLGEGIPVDAKFFRNLEETLNSEPDTVLNKTILKARKRRYGIYYHRLDVDRKVGRAIGKVYGFTDGQEVYINPGTPKLRKGTDFYKVERIDRFLHYKVVERITFPVAGAAPAVIEFPAEKLLDTETGKSKTLTRGRLRKLIADDEELLAAFNQEKRKSKKLKLYLETYYERKQQ